MKKWCLLALACVLLAVSCTVCAQETARKVVYLTFDDGPKEDTPELIALLEELDVPATFFFVGAKVKAFPQEGRLVYDKGYPIGCHSVYHGYSGLKVSGERTLRDSQKFLEIMREHIAEDFTTDLYRFPGGSTSYPSKIRRYMTEAGWAWFDWNAETGDTRSLKKTQDLYNLAVKEAGDAEVVILLAHEGKKRTREILPQLVDYFKGRGYEFRTLSTSEGEREILARCPANMMLPELRQEDEAGEETP